MQSHVVPSSLLKASSLEAPSRVVAMHRGFQDKEKGLGPQLVDRRPRKASAVPRGSNWEGLWIQAHNVSL